jgi:hypothetical protein
MIKGRLLILFVLILFFLFPVLTSRAQDNPAIENSISEFEEIKSDIEKIKKETEKVEAKKINIKPIEERIDRNLNNSEEEEEEHEKKKNKELEEEKKEKKEIMSQNNSSKQSVSTDFNLQTGCEIIDSEKLGKIQEKIKKIDHLLVELKLTRKRGGENEEMELKEKINELQREIKEIEGKCISGLIRPGVQIAPLEIPMFGPQEAFKPKNPEEISVYYKQKMIKILKEASSIDQKIEELKNLRMEIDQMIQKLIQEEKRIKMDEIRDLVGEIKIEPSKIKFNEIEVLIETTKEVAVETKGKEIRVKIDPTEIKIEDGSFEVQTNNEVVIKNDALVVVDKKIEVLPTEATSFFKIKPEEVRHFELKVENERPVYQIKVVEKRKFLGFIPVNINREIKIDASSKIKQILEDKKPWWSFLTIK